MGTSSKAAWDHITGGQLDGIEDHPGNKGLTEVGRLILNVGSSIPQPGLLD